MSTRADKVFPIANGRVYAIGTKSIFLGYTDSLGYFPITGLCPGTKIVVRKADMLPLETSVFDGNSCPEGDSRSDNGADQVIIPPVSGPKRQSGGDGVCLFTNGDPTDNIGKLETHCALSPETQEFLFGPRNIEILYSLLGPSVL